MPQDTSKHQTNNEPAWLKPVKRAVLIMSVLIVAGLGLLSYGLVTRIGDLSASTASGAVAIEYPQHYAKFQYVFAGDDGDLFFVFSDQTSHDSYDVMRLSSDGQHLDVVAHIRAGFGSEFTLSPVAK